MRLPDDAELIKRCLRGNQEAWEELIFRYERLIYFTAVRSGASSAEADDVFQNVCLIWLKELRKLRNPERLGAWLVTITRREFTAQWRQHEKQDRIQGATQAEIDTHQPSPEALAAQSDDARVVQRSLEQLSETCKELLWLLFFHPGNPSYEETARQLGVSVNSIGPRRARCLAQLKEILEQSGW